jgi:arylsulfatase A-like enzyme
MVNRREFCSALLPALQRRERLNIVWLIAEDNGPQWGCYGYPLVRTPHVDRLAAQGELFRNAFTTAPVCSPSRSAWNTGMYQTAIGAHHHRSHRDDGYRLPEGVKLVSERLREQGYFTANVLAPAPGVRGTGKTDFNFQADRPFDGKHWNERQPGQPFFAQVNFQATHKGPSFPEARRQEELIDLAKVELPPYWPDHPVVRDEFANYLDCVNLLDGKIGRVLETLDKDGLAENTVVFFFGDNGRCLIRGKQWLYDAGIHVPLIVRWPSGVKPGTVRPDLVSAIDITATTLWLAGAPLPEKMHGRPLYGPQAKRREAVFAARDRCDDTMDKIRCVRTARHKLIRNYMPERPYTQQNDYIERSYPTLGAMKELHAAGKLKGSELLFMADRKPSVELYDVGADPHEVRNLAASPAHQQELKKLNGMLDEWVRMADPT